MKTKFNLRVSIFFVILFLAGNFIYCQDLNDIVKKSRAPSAAPAKSISVELELIKNGGESSITLDLYAKKINDNSTKMNLSVNVTSPESLAGTRFVTLQTAKGAEQWVKTKGHEARRLTTTTMKRRAFMGTDLYFDDLLLLRRPVDADTYKLLGEENYGGALCYVIEASPKEKFRYSKIKLWIEKETFLNRKLELFGGKKEKLLKVFEIPRYETVQGRKTPAQLIISTPQEKTSTTINVSKVVYDGPVGDFNPSNS